MGQQGNLSFDKTNGVKLDAAAVGTEEEQKKHADGGSGKISFRGTRFEEFRGQISINIPSYIIHHLKPKLDYYVFSVNYRPRVPNQMYRE